MSAEAVVALATAIVTLVSVLVTLFVKLSKVHVLVNSKMTEALDRIAQLTAALTDSHVDVPVKPGRHEAQAQSVVQAPRVDSLTGMESFKRFAQAAGQKIREGWKAVFALATPILLTALGDIIDVVGDYIELEYGTSVWVGIVSMLLVWFKRNLNAGEA